MPVQSRPMTFPGESKPLRDYATAPGSPFAKMHLDKNEMLCRQGDICHYFTFVSSGILQHGVYVDGDEKTTYLALRNSFTSALESFLNDIPSRKFIKALVPTELLYLERNTFLELMSADPVFKQAYLDLIEKQICRIDDYRIDLLSLSAEERYLKLLQTEPVLLQQVPLHLLSSFLGISIRHMSRIRKNIK